MRDVPFPQVRGLKAPTPEMGTGPVAAGRSSISRCCGGLRVSLARRFRGGIERVEGRHRDFVPFDADESVSAARASARSARSGSKSGVTFTVA